MRQILFGFVVFCDLAAANATYADGREATGWTALQVRLGPDMLTGAGVRVMQVEGPTTNGSYLAFTNPGTGEFAGKTVIAHSGPVTVSPHAAEVGATWYGNTRGYAPGITAIEAYLAPDFLMELLNIQTAPEASGWPALLEDLNLGEVRIVNHSWIATPGDPAGEAAFLRAVRRADFIVDTHDVFFICGVDNNLNGVEPPIPPLMASMYNGITVGLENGKSSKGPATFDGVRAKPDLVAPETLTSYAAPQVAGSVAMLLELAARLNNPAAAKPQVIKAALMSAASKPAGWKKGDGPESDDETYPLDRVWGAGSLRIDRAYDILAAGRQTPNQSAELGVRGWAFEPITSQKAHDYKLNLSLNNTTAAVTIAWHRRHSGDFLNDAMLRLNTIELEFWSGDPTRSGATLLQASRSTVDNIQHVYVTGLTPGIYTVRARRLTDLAPTEESYGLAWFTLGDAPISPPPVAPESPQDPEMPTNEPPSEPGPPPQSGQGLPEGGEQTTGLCVGAAAMIIGAPLAALMLVRRRRSGFWPPPRRGGGL